MTPDRDRLHQPVQFSAAPVALVRNLAEERVRAALESVLPTSAAVRQDIHRELLSRFKDEASPENFWHAASSQSFRDFFVWGHDYDWGGECRRSGAMGSRHIEIAIDSIERGLLPVNLSGQRVLDIGCWSGGDMLLLKGLGAEVEAIEEHRRSAESARGLCELLGLPTTVSTASVYADRVDWAGRFDVIYCSGVIYHVTDPVLFLRICFAYLKVGGRLIVETKALDGGTGSLCSSSGTCEKGWNWFAPNWDALGRWLTDAGFEASEVHLHRRSNGRLLGGDVKARTKAMRETAGFSRPGSWLEGET